MNEPQQPRPEIDAVPAAPSAPEATPPAGEPDAWTEDSAEPQAEPQREPPEEVDCPFCLSAIPGRASKCPACGANVGDIQTCPNCAEPVRAAALFCPFCRTDLRPPPPTPDILAEPWTIYASPLGAGLSETSATALFFPPTMTVSNTEIHVRRWSLMGLRSQDQKISTSRIASVRALSGVIWGGIVIETYGGATGDLAILGLDKQEAKHTAAIIDRIARMASGDRTDR